MEYDSETALRDIRTLPQKASNILAYKWERVRSTSIFPITDQSPITFEIQGYDNAFIDTKNIQKILKFRVRKRQADGSLANLNHAESKTVVPINGFLWTFFGDVHLDVQHRAFFKQYNCHDILSYLKLLFTASNEAKNNILQNGLWYQDVGAGHSVIQGDYALAPGEYTRNRRTMQSSIVLLQGALLLDPFEVSKPYPENVSFTLRFYPNPPKKCIVHPDENLDLVIEILDMSLLVPRIYPKAALLKQPVSIAYVQNEVIRIMIPTGQRHFGPRTVKIAETLPRRAIVFLWTENQLNGSYTESRLALNPLRVNKCLLQCNGVHLPFWDGYNVDFDDYHYNELYDGIFKQLSLDPSTVSVSRTQFGNGFTIFPFDVSGQALSSEYYPTKQSGILELTLQFKEPTTQNIALMLILTNEKIVSFNKNREFKDQAALESGKK
jgi:hypothetical protein